MIDENAIRHEIYAVCSDMGIEVSSLTARDKGKVMGKLMPKIKGKADGNLVNKIVSEYCK